MARHSRMQTLNSMYEQKLTVVFYNSDFSIAKQVVQACVDGGARVIEFTNRGDFAWQVFAELEKHCSANLPQVVLGVGSIVDPQTAGLYINCGANFVVGPVLNEEVARTCNRRKIPYMPGCGSASEISKAEELGCEIVKIFPGDSVGGPSFVKSIKAPCPWTSLMPTGGVEPTEASLREWFKAGITCAGIGSQLISKDLMEKRDFAKMTTKVRETLSIIKAITA